MGKPATWSMLYGDGGLKSMDIAAVLDGSYDVYISHGSV